MTSTKVVHDFIPRFWSNLAYLGRLLSRDSLHLSNLIRRRSSLFRPSLPALSLAPPAKSIPLTVFWPAPPPLSQSAHPRISSLSRWSIQINLVFSKR
ncbi:hypothetical protein DY000_02017674 [Brassica cretica]|uniref:Uncharacterized protein n=1 Tax=Brassica cretica TaxID=69181 RepID=A0ABQ7CUJ0_BRACR|nr:hypothetical protein DY000_02017674 [Brassica cretica]